MSRLGWLTSIPLLAILSCGRNDSPDAPSSDGDAIELETIDPPSGGEMLLVPGGEFTMGQGGGRPDETPHAVKLDPFVIDRHPVTQRLYEKVMKASPSRRKDPDAPVSGVYWTDAARFCNRCSEIEGLTPCYDLETWSCDVTASGYRLPTEAEWEYACRAGSTACDLKRHAWYADNADKPK